MINSLWFLCLHFPIMLIKLQFSLTSKSYFPIPINICSIAIQFHFFSQYVSFVCVYKRIYIVLAALKRIPLRPTNTQSLDPFAYRNVYFSTYPYVSLSIYVVFVQFSDRYTRSLSFSHIERATREG